MRVLLLLPTSSYRVADFLGAASRLGIDVVVASEEASTMEPLQGSRLLTLDLLDPEGAADDVVRFHESRPIDAVLGVDEETSVVAATVSHRLGLPHHSAEAALRARLKHRMREALSTSGVASPAHRVVTTSEDPERVGSELDYPVVVKPVFLSGSRGVVRADEAAGFVAAFARIRRLLASDALMQRGGENARLILIEAYVPGREVAVEGLLTEGRLTPLAIFDKPDPLEGPYFEETIYITPSRLPPPNQEGILRTTSRAAEAVGLHHGPIHAELRLPEGGSPTVIEIAGRSIGGLCARTLRFGIGKTLEEVILEHAVRTASETVASIEREASAAGVMMIPIPRAGVLEAVEGIEAARSLPDIEEVTLTAHLGQELVPLPEGASYLGFIFARAETPELAEVALRRAHQSLRFDVRRV